MFSDKNHIEMSMKNKQQIVCNCQNADKYCDQHKYKSVENQVPLYIRRHTENSIRPRTQFSEKININEIVEIKAFLRSHRWCSVEVKEHQ
jgi:hypothetical protein